MAGLPGTGLGGVFYILLLVWIVLREVWLMAFQAQRRASGRWREIFSLTSIAGLIIAALYLEGLLLHKAQLQISAVAGPSHAAPAALELLIPAIAASPLIVLSLLLSSVHLLAKFYPPEPSSHLPESIRMGASEEKAVG